MYICECVVFVACRKVGTAGKSTALLRQAIGSDSTLFNPDRFRVTTQVVAAAQRIASDVHPMSARMERDRPGPVRC